MENQTVGPKSATLRGFASLASRASTAKRSSWADCLAVYTRKNASALCGAQEPAGEGPAGDCAILTLVVRNGTPSVRPDDVLSALRGVADLVPPTPPRVTRLAQGPLDQHGTTVFDPFEPDRAAEAEA